MRSALCCQTKTPASSGGSVCQKRCLLKMCKVCTVRLGQVWCRTDTSSGACGRQLPLKGKPKDTHRYVLREFFDSLHLPLKGKAFGRSGEIGVRRGSTSSGTSCHLPLKGKAFGRSGVGWVRGGCSFVCCGLTCRCSPASAGPPRGCASRGGP